MSYHFIGGQKSASYARNITKVSPVGQIYFACLLALARWKRDTRFLYMIGQLLIAVPGENNAYKLNRLSTQTLCLQYFLIPFGPFYSRNDIINIIIIVVVIIRLQTH